MNKFVAVLGLSSLVAVTAKPRSAVKEVPQPVSQKCSNPHCPHEKLKASLFTVESTWNFTKETVSLAYHMGHFFVVNTWTKGCEVADEHCPPEIKKGIAGNYNKLADEVSALKIHYNVPTCEYLQGEVASFYEQVVKPQGETALEKVQLAYSFVPEDRVRAFVARFEASYPEMKGKLPRDNVVDILFSLCVVLYLLFGVFLGKIVLPAVKYVVCCGACRRRKAVAAAPAKKASSSQPAAKKSNNAAPAAAKNSGKKR